MTNDKLRTEWKKIVWKKMIKMPKSMVNYKREISVKTDIIKG